VQIEFAALSHGAITALGMPFDADQRGSGARVSMPEKPDDCRAPSAIDRDVFVAR